MAASQWLAPPEDEDGVPIQGSSNNNLGVVLQRDDGGYAAHPAYLNENVVKACLSLDVPAAFTMSSEVTQALLRQIQPNQTQFGDQRTGIVLPIINSIEDLGSGKVNIPKDNFICLCRQEQFVLVWGDTVEGILAQGADIETWLVGIVRWKFRPILTRGTNSLQVWGAAVPVEDAVGSPRTSSPFGRRSFGATLATPQYPGMNTPMPPMPPMAAYQGYGGYGKPEMNEKWGVIEQAIAREEEGDKAFDPEKDGAEAPKRPFLLTHALCIGLAMILVVVVEMACVAKLLTEVRLDGSYLRFALLLTVPMFASFSLVSNLCEPLLQITNKC